MTHEEAIDAVVLALRTGPRREPAAKATKIRNYALTLERLADLDEEWAAMRVAAAKLYAIADEIQL